jgi:hypothetical protein
MPVKKKLEVKVPECLTKHHAVMKHGGVMIWYHAFFTFQKRANNLNYI